ncbi:PAQR family membrane homeostasis protein TrhA [Mesorhizobium sp. L-8-3]|uniref:PAQR family membrane homeostasis protein TrhA n=1 Tax=Mesorhizobium sp. L-8-3 TaxID=2744522 RepID=UPI0019275107|nr:hemolysin III family protein [Mesorhizobium sp. L-8-3]BCH22408.1 DNA-binding protein [Mesorhizobium sp. L-8-3]
MQGGDAARSVLETPFAGRFLLSRAELIADGIVHAVGIVLAISAGSILLAFAVFHTGVWEYVAAIFYVASLLTVLSISCAYNLWPVSRAKWILRRFDHAAIYLLIAGTYTPFLTQLDDPATAQRMFAVVWGAAATGMAVKLFLPGRFDRLAIVFYLAIGWSGVAVAQGLLDTLPATTLWLIVAGGVVYSSGVVFFVWQGLRFQSAVWHGFVVVAAGLHLAAVMDCLVVNRI